MKELTYTRIGDYYIPALKVAEPEKPIGKYDRMRYLKEHRPALYSSPLLTEKIYPHLLESDEAANERMDILMPQLMKNAGVTEELKAVDPMKWVGTAKACKAQVEKIFIQNWSLPLDKRVSSEYYLDRRSFCKRTSVY